ncbi:MAG: 1-deoxy-D-xylulose-5-phosphate reductoisomerase [Pseudomonadota bacterium]|jgi:1-deoxy-D-xylulose-5-phosphate reductoisomerase
MKNIAILGSTGSIGVSTIQVVEAAPEQFRVDLLVAGGNVARLAEQIRRCRPRVAGLAQRERLTALCAELGISETARRFGDTQLISGNDEILEAVRQSNASIVVAAVVGMAGLGGVVAALESGKDVALANKESLVVAGSLIVEKARARGVRLIPVDSEHSAIFQALQGVPQEDVQSVVLTASGGPFLKTPIEQFSSITPEQAVRHPKWNMGAKISVDSATLMNKALEVIEARWLFDVEPDAIEVVVHPQSVIHSMVRLRDGGLLAQLSVPDMKGPIAYALTFPGPRLSGVIPRLDFAQLGQLTFEDVDHVKFPSINRALACLRGARGASAVLNAANEVAVAEFLNGKLAFSSIFNLVDRALDQFGGNSYTTLDNLDELCTTVTEWARQIVRSE